MLSVEVDISKVEAMLVKKSEEEEEVDWYHSHVFLKSPVCRL